MVQNYKEIKATAKIFPDFAERTTLPTDVITSTHISLGYSECLWEDHTPLRDQQFVFPGPSMGQDERGYSKSCGYRSLSDWPCC